MINSRVYESQYIVNTYHAMNFDTGEIIEADGRGYISPAAGTRICFPDPYGSPSSRYVDLSQIVFFTEDDPLKVEINDNTMYPFYVPANDVRGVNYMRIYSFRVLSGGSFYAEGLSSET